MKIKDYLESLPKQKFSLIKWFKNIFIQKKLNKAIYKWNKDIPYIKKCIEQESTKENDRFFYWKQLILQEIIMYIKLNKKIDINEFVWLCNRRGFTLKEQNYLQSMMQFIGLMK